MARVLLLVGGILVVGAQAAAALDRTRAPLSTQAPASAATLATSRMIVAVPHDETELVVEGKTIPGTGTSRDFETPPLETGTTHRYTFTATWQPNTYTTITRRKTVVFRAGERIVVDLTIDDPNDRARVVYVPTPSDVADEMVRLAGVTAADIVYEPGCGDARVTIAAVKGGAKRGVGIDIDPERVADSRARVKEAGLEEKVEIRQDDALDIRDLSAATVVFLYMGDHFNMLIRPILWKELKVGARVVSHRFRMGDWLPDKTVSVSSPEGGEYELHLWTVTEELKRKMQGDAARPRGSRAGYIQQVSWDPCSRDDDFSRRPARVCSHGRRSWTRGLTATSSMSASWPIRTSSTTTIEVLRGTRRTPSRSSRHAIVSSRRALR